MGPVNPPDKPNPLLLSSIILTDKEDILVSFVELNYFTQQKKYKTW